MAINAYTGLMGSGKSYEVVASVVLPAVEAGRRVVTNVDGINGDLICAYLVQHRGADAAKLGTVVHVSNADVGRDDFFPDENMPEQVSIVQLGDLVCIDEAWRFWGSSMSISKNHMQFFRMHRHYVHAGTGVACDVAVMVQAIGDLHRTLRSVVEMTARMTKLKTLGLNRSYRVELFEGDKITKTAKFETFVKRYDKAIFPLYRSYAGTGQGKEAAIDKRQNVLRNPRIWLVGSLMLLMLAASTWYLLHYFNKYKSPGIAKGAELGSIQQPSPAGPGAGSVTPQQAGSADVLRLAGEVMLNGERWIVLADQAGRLRFENPALFVGRGLGMVGEVHGQRVASWTGTMPGPSQVPSVASGVPK